MELLKPAWEILERAQRISFFRNVGGPAENSSIERLIDWRTALKTLLSRRSQDFFLDARNAMGRTTFLRKAEQYNTWCDVVDEADKVLVPEIQPRIEAGLPLNTTALAPLKIYSPPGR